MIRNIVFDMGQVILRFDPVFFLDRGKITDPQGPHLNLGQGFLAGNVQDLLSGLGKISAHLQQQEQP